MQRIAGCRVAVLAGGESPEREVSLASGRNVVQALHEAGYEVALVDPAERSVDWIAGQGFAGCFLALHGGAGEDGRLQAELQRRGIPYTGSGPEASRLAMSKSAAKAVWLRAGVPTPEYLLLECGDLSPLSPPTKPRPSVAPDGESGFVGPPRPHRSPKRERGENAATSLADASGYDLLLECGDPSPLSPLTEPRPSVTPGGESGFIVPRSPKRERGESTTTSLADASGYDLLLECGDGSPHSKEILARVGLPVILKPDGSGSSLGVGLARVAGEIAGKLDEARRFGPRVLAERYIEGREFTVSVLGRRALPLLEIVGRVEVFDYRSKYASQAIRYHFDSGLAPMKIEEVQQAAVAAADALGTTGLVRVDLILDRAERPWVLELNTLPGMTDHSLSPMAAAQAGISMSQLCDWILRDGWAQERR